MRVHQKLTLGVMLILSLYILWQAGGFCSKYYKYQKAKSKTLQLEVNNGNRYAKNQPNRNSSTDNSLINELQDLTDYSIIGAFFMEQKILELAKIDQWQKVINESLKAIQTRANKNSFSIWYHKALAQCILQKISDCEQSAERASFLSSDSYHDGYLKELFLYIREMKKQQKKKEKKRMANKQNDQKNIQYENEQQKEIQQSQRTEQKQKQILIKNQQDSHQHQSSFQESDAYYSTFEEVDSAQSDNQNQNQLKLL